MEAIAGALARWVDGLQAAETAAALEPFATPGHAEHQEPELLLSLLAIAAAHHPAAHARIAAALEALDPLVEIRCTCVAGEQLAAQLAVGGHEPTVADLHQDDAFTVEVPCSALFGPPAGYRGDGTVALRAQDATAQHTLGVPQVLQAGGARLVAIATIRA
jgi:hypothetical protein